MLCGQVPGAVCLTCEEWGPESGLVTAAMKLKRRPLQVDLHLIHHSGILSQDASGHIGAMFPGHACVIFLTQDSLGHISDGKCAGEISGGHQPDVWTLIQDQSKKD